MKLIVHNLGRVPFRLVCDGQPIRVSYHNKDDVGFKESEHPRNKSGEFAEGGNSGESGRSGKTAHVSTKVNEKGERVSANGSALPAHIQALKIPPAWSDVTYSEDPKAALQATGKDSKGRRQAVYSSEFSANQAAAKFSRINELNDKYVEISKQNDEARKSNNDKVRNSADCAFLIMKTGIRPGSDEDTGADKKAYGATTLEGRHVVVTGEDVHLRFVGKKGVDLNLPVLDPEVKRMLKDRKTAAGENGKLFGVNERNLLDHVHSLDGGGFKTKDFRTLLGTQTAMSEVEKQKPPIDEKSYKKAVMAVAKVVSQKLGNTPTIALQSYINPSVFAQWKVGVP